MNVNIETPKEKVSQTLGFWIKLCFVFSYSIIYDEEYKLIFYKVPVTAFWMKYEPQELYAESIFHGNVSISIYQVLWYK